MSVIGSNIIAGASGTIETGYQIARSLRFNSADSAYLNRTPASAGNRNRWTVAFWIKPTLQNISNVPTILGVDTSATDAIQFEADYTMNIVAGGVSVLRTSRVFRDPASFMHVVISADTTNATAANKLKVSINGSLETAFSTDTRSSLTTNSFKINNALIHHIGNNPAVARYLGAYLADFYFIDGQALDPTNFGEFDANTGVWAPKAYTGTYGTNGFWLKFDDNSGVTATTLGKDSSGNGNNWTPNNFSVTAGVGNDSLVDSPTNYGTDTGAGGEVRGNYATLNPLQMGSPASITNGLIDLAPYTGNTWGTALSTIVVNSGKWYFEATVGSTTGASFTNVIGIVLNPSAYYTSTDIGTIGYGGAVKSTGLTGYALTVAGTTLSTTISNGSVLHCAVDVDAGRVWIGVGGSYIGGGNPATNTSPTYTFTANSNVALGVSTFSGLTSANFGQRPFAYTAPSGFKALNTQNLPTPAIGASAGTLASKNMNVVTYTGDGTSPRTVSGFGFQPDFVWVKNRSISNAHTLHDVLRGAGTNKALYSNATVAETSGDTNLYGYLSAFTTDGFSATAGTGATPQSYFNTSGNGYVGWAWKANGAGVSNTAGSISSTVSANTAAGISIVSYTGTGANGTVGHGLGAAPRLILIKSRSAASTNWNSYHASIGAGSTIVLNLTIAATAGSQFFNNTAPTSTVFSVGTDGSINPSGATQIAYCFAEVAGFSKFGSYVGNGSADGPFVYCGFRPRWIMYKASSGTSDWVVIDTTRDDFNVADSYLLPNSSAAEATSAIYDVLSNGFKCRSATFANTSAVTYIFAAFAEAPFNYARAR